MELDINLIKFNKNVLINGLVQSGKTKIIIELAKKAQKTGYDVCILLNNFKMDLNQIKKRFDMTEVESVKYLNTISQRDFSIKPTIYVTLCNFKKVEKFNDLYENHKIKLKLMKIDRKIVTIIDESDIFNQDLEKNTLENLSKISNELKKTFKNSISNIKITATSYSHMYVEEIFPISSSDVYFINPDSSYISYGHEKFSVHEIDDLYLSLKKQEWSKVEVEYFIDILREIREYYTGYSILPITIVNVAISIKKHLYIKNIIKEHIPDSTLIVINEGSVTVSDNIEFYTIQDALSYIKRKGTSVQVIIITCKQMGRGISVRSEIPNFTDIKDIVYANSMIYCCSDTKSSDELIQSSLRISGKFPKWETVEGFELKLYTTEKINKSLEEQIKWSSDIKQNIQESQESQEVKKLTELIVPLEEKPIRKPISNSRGKFYCKKIGDSYECTKARITTKILEEKTSDWKDMEWIERIVTVIKDHSKGIPMTCDDISRIGISLNAWEGLKIEDGQCKASIATHLKREISRENSRLTRKFNSEGIYEYSLN
jgi:hypothetical protein